MALSPWSIGSDIDVWTDLPAISGSFVRDLVLPTADREAQDVSHVIAAVGSRDVKKAEKFIQENCPDGGDAQKTGLSDVKMSPKGSYKDCVEDPVSLPHLPPLVPHLSILGGPIKSGYLLMMDRTSRPYILEPRTQRITTTANSRLRLANTVSWKR